MTYINNVRERGRRSACISLRIDELPKKEKTVKKPHETQTLFLFVRGLNRPARLLSESCAKVKKLASVCSKTYILEKIISSGDPGVFAMAAAVLETANDDSWRDVPVRVVPGMTAAQAVAARVGAPLGHDFGMISLSDRLKPFAVVEKRIRALASADMAFAVYNPASKERRWQVAKLRQLVLEYQQPNTPVIVARAVGSADEEVTITTLENFNPDIVDMRTMVIIGASTTKVYQSGTGQTRVYTSRKYG